MPDWLYTIIGWILLALAALVMWWIFMHDRPRGKKRCPRCWYHLRGVPPDASSPRGLPRCPECGHLAKRAGALRKTRRRWRATPVVALLLLGAYVVMHVPEVVARGWWALAPRPVVLAYMLWEPEMRQSGTTPGLPAGRPTTAARLIAARGGATAGTATPWFAEFQLRYIDNRPGGWWPGESLLATWVMNRSVRFESDELVDYAALALVEVRDGAVTAVSDAARPRVLLAKVARTYAVARTYQDHAVRFNPRFDTAVWASAATFERSGSRILFEYDLVQGDRTSSSAHGESECGVAWGADGKYFEATTKARQPQPFTKMESAAWGGFGEFALRRCLIGKTVLLPGASGIRIEGESTFDGHECYHMLLQSNSGLNDLLVDKQSFLVRRIVRGEGRVVILRPVVNEPIAEAAFQAGMANLPGLQDRMQAILTELRPLANLESVARAGSPLHAPAEGGRAR